MPFTSVLRNLNHWTKTKWSLLTISPENVLVGIDNVHVSFALCLKTGTLINWLQYRCFIQQKASAASALIESHLERSKVVSYSITRVGLRADPVSWQSACWWFSHKPGGRLPLLSTRHVVTFPAKKSHLVTSEKYLPRPTFLNYRSINQEFPVEICDRTLVFFSSAGWDIHISCSKWCLHVCLSEC